MKESKVIRKIYGKICKWLSIKNMSIMTIVFFLIMLVPVFYLSFVNRASGDDYGYGTYTRAAWMTTYSLSAVGKAIWKTIRQYYYGWQGTWFSIFLFSLQPEVFHDDAYVIVVFLMLFLWIGSTFLLFYEFLVRKMKVKKWGYILITLLFLIMNIQYIPSTKSAIFWFNGCAHYMIPFTMCQVVVYWLMRFVDKYKIGHFIGICLFMTLLGGASYQTALITLIVAVYVGIIDFGKKKNKKIFLLLIPIAMEMVGLIISMKAPGNKVRGGEDFGLSISQGIKTIGMSFVGGIIDIGNYLQEKPLVFVGLLLMFLILFEILKDREIQIKIKYPVFMILALFCLYSAMQAPAIYAGVDVSSGVYNVNYQMFLLCICGTLLIVVNQMVDSIIVQRVDLHDKMVIPGLLVCLLLVIIFKGNIKDSTSWKCLNYITTGQASDYKEQMDLQTELLSNESVSEVILPFINDVQGPLMHMPVTANPEAWTNTVTKQFYGKDNVVAMPRPEWEEMYGGNKS